MNYSCYLLHLQDNRQSACLEKKLKDLLALAEWIQAYQEIDRKSKIQRRKLDEAIRRSGSRVNQKSRTTRSDHNC